MSKTTSDFTILVVEDEDFFRRSLKMILEKRGFKVEAVSDGNLAFELISKRVPDLVLLDMEMPVINGIEVAKQLRSYETYRDLPIIMLTGLGDRKTITLALEAGVNDYIVKPPKQVILLEKICKQLSIEFSPSDLSSEE